MIINIMIPGTELIKENATLLVTSKTMYITKNNARIPIISSILNLLVYFSNNQSFMPYITIVSR